MQTLRCIFLIFDAVSGLKINLEKSKVFGVGYIPDAWEIGRCFGLQGGLFSIFLPWRGIIKFIDDFREGLSWVVGNGQRMPFWEDKWCGNIPLKQVYPTIFSLAVSPRAMVADYMDLSHGTPIWQPTLKVGF